MSTSMKASPQNSVVIIEDTGGGQVPTDMGGMLVAATPSCIAVGCRSELDGETELILDSIDKVDPKLHQIFEGKLLTPSLSLRIASVLGETFLEMPVERPEINVRVWANDTFEPTVILVGVGSPMVTFR